MIANVPDRIRGANAEEIAGTLYDALTEGNGDLELILQFTAIDSNLETGTDLNLANLNAEKELSADSRKNFVRAFLEYIKKGKKFYPTSLIGAITSISNTNYAPSITSPSDLRIYQKDNPTNYYWIEGGVKKTNAWLTSLILYGSKIKGIVGNCLKTVLNPTNLPEGVGLSLKKPATEPYYIEVQYQKG